MKNIYLTLVVGLFLVPTILISQTVSISGQITRHNGDPVSDIEVNCDGFALTDMDGNFEFTDVAVNHTCELFAMGQFDKYEDVTVLDVTVLQQLILGIGSTSEYQILACDVNNSTSVSAIDMVKMMQSALKLPNSASSDWLFVDADHVFSMPFTNVPTTIYINATDTIVDADLIAIKRGDPAINSDYMPAPPEAPSPIITISDEVFQAGDDVQFEVTVEDFSNIVGFQQTFKWDPNVLSFENVVESSGVSLNVNDLEVITNQGLLPTLTLMNFQTVQNGDVVMILNFKALVDVGINMEVLSFSDELTSRQVVWQNPVDNELFIVEGEYMNGEGTTGIVNTPSGLQSFQVFPNPVEDNFNVKALLGNAEDFEISIVNVLGQKVYVENFNQKELNLNIGFGGFPAGTYFLSLKTADGIRTESFVKK